MNSNNKSEPQNQSGASLAPSGGSAYKVFVTKDSGEMEADPDGNPRCPDCNGQVMKCGIDIYKCRKCGEGWTMEKVG